MNVFKRNMFGEINWICYLFGHSFILVGNPPYMAVCQLCELNNPKFKKKKEVGDKR